MTIAVIDRIADGVQVNPMKALRLYHVYFSATPEPPDLSRAFDQLLRQEVFFLQSKFAEQFLHLIVMAFTTRTILQAQYLDKICSLFRTILESGNGKLVEMVLGIMYADPSFDKLLKNVRFEELLENPETMGNGLILIYRYHERMRITTTLLQLLLSVAKTSKVSAYLLMQMCDNPQIGLTLAKRMDDWAGIDLPTVRMTVKLMLAIARWPANRQVIAECESLPKMLTRVVKVADPKVLPILGKIVQSLPIGPMFVKDCNTFFEEYFPLVVAKYRESQAFIVDALTLTDSVSRVGFSTHYLTVLPVLEVAIKTPGWAQIVVPVIANLSRHEPIRKNLLDAGFKTLMLGLASDFKLAEYVHFFTKNMQSVN
jgi:hypothetical protein